MAKAAVYGAAYLIGKVPAASYGAGGLIHDRDAVKLSPALLGSSVKGAKFVTGACARAHCFLVDDQGEVWGCGSNVVGQLGLVSRPHCSTKHNLGDH
jgi:alpha-tubulin suppressor-like RCC1 family protein